MHQYLGYLTSVSIGTIDTYLWNFGDGATPATATGSGPHTVIYGTEDTRKVSLTVTNSAGNDKKEIDYMFHNCNLGVENPTENSKDIIVFPNPSSGIFHLSKELDWKIYSVLGTKIKEGSGNVINIFECPSGVYFIKNAENNKTIHILKK